ncbi:MAG: helix-turn-helix domain-containing protein [Zoogloeaceae bacterium]|nr:helix-turn-helix domain-containing protein [Zoogloeaceae bacterium]
MTNVIPLRPSAPVPATTAPVVDWLDANRLSNLAGIAPANARDALCRGKRGEAWQGVVLDVREVGGVLACRPDSLPEPLFAAWLERHGGQLEPASPVESTEPAATVTAPVSIDPRATERMAVGLWRLTLIRPVLEHPAGSGERNRMVHEIASRRHIKPGGREVTVSVSSLRNWIRDYERGGVAALADKPRKDKGRGRVQVSREWDSALAERLGAELVAAITAELTTYVRSLWRSGVAGWRECADLAGTWLVERSEQALAEAGETMGREVLAHCCSVSRRRVEAEREFAVVAQAENDAKAFFDTMIPRIRRHREGMLPMDLVVGDVTPLDIYMDREDGSQVTARLISWLDMATNRLWLSIYIPPKGRGVTRLQVAASFASMCASWGLPRRLYLDNGSEYNWAEMLTGFAQLSRMSAHMQVSLLSDADPRTRSAVDDVRGELIRARAYNAPAKPIEGIFSVINTVISMLPGYVGGDRMRKKTHNVGKAPVSFPGGPRDLLDALNVALTRYHNKAQSGSLAKRSPREVYQQHIDAGWRRVAVDSLALLLSFADELERTVHQGRVQYTPRTGGTVYYTHDRLLPLSTRKVRVRIPAHDPRFCFVFRPGSDDLLCCALPDPTFHALDLAGAKEQSRRHGELRRWIAERKQDCDLLDLVEELRRHNTHSPAMPEAPIGARVEVTEEIAAMLAAVEQEASRALDDQQVRRASAGQLSQWGDDEDPYLDAVGWGDE